MQYLQLIWHLLETGRVVCTVVSANLCNAWTLAEDLGGLIQTISSCGIDAVGATLRHQSLEYFRVTTKYHQNAGQY